MYQMPLSYQPQVNHMHQSDQIPTIAMQPYIPHQMSPHSCNSFITTPVFTVQPYVPSLMSIYDYSSQPKTPLVTSPRMQSLNISQPIVLPPVTLENDLLYNCNYLGQLQGSYEIDAPEGQDQISVIVPHVNEVDEQYAIVRRVCSDGEALPDQFIYEKLAMFTLCSADGTEEAVLTKGNNMRHTVEWECPDKESRIVWRRKGEVTFNLVPVDSLTSSRRDSICSMGSSTTGLSSSAVSPGSAPSVLPIHIQPELLQPGFRPNLGPVLMNTPPYESPTSNNNFEEKLRSPDATSVGSDDEEQAMFELIKAHCEGNSCLLKKMVHWAMKNCSKRRVSDEEMRDLSEGHLWITAHPADFTQDAETEECAQESLDNIKGAYRKVRPGVYKQPDPQENEPGIQHRLSKCQGGYLKIEGYNLNIGDWEICAKELPDRRWVDMKNNGEVIRVQLVPMNEILKKMDEEFIYSNHELAKGIEFLFTSCNQKKLNSKLKGRNLKHNISNLKQKLEKQYDLTFAVQVACTAETIALELDGVR